MLTGEKKKKEVLPNYVDNRMWILDVESTFRYKKYSFKNPLLMKESIICVS